METARTGTLVFGHRTIESNIMPIDLFESYISHYTRRSQYSIAAFTHGYYVYSNMLEILYYNTGHDSSVLFNI